ncbi:hypothetical protein ACCO45_005197 [Purpureocillium lilacinum]|uniref:Uncharacterized protein n=1 Tax=Purpureocillium lilacinum TaxID=33203 RepID=A0ACC4DXL5_PURLI
MASSSTFEPETLCANSRPLPPRGTRDDGRANKAAGEIALVRAGQLPPPHRSSALLVWRRPRRGGGGDGSSTSSSSGGELQDPWMERLGPRQRAAAQARAGCDLEVGQARLPPLAAARQRARAGCQPPAPANAPAAEVEGSTGSGASTAPPAPPAPGSRAPQSPGPTPSRAASVNSLHPGYVPKPPSVQMGVAGVGGPRFASPRHALRARSAPVPSHILMGKGSLPARPAAQVLPPPARTASPQ